MQRFACIQDDVVVYIVELADDIALAEAFHPDFVATLVPAANGAVEGALFKDGKFSAPKPAEIPAPSRLSFLEFMDLFTDDEQLAIAGAAMTDVPTKLWYDRAVGAQFIDLGDERLAAGLQKMVDAKLLTGARRNRVLKGLAPA